MEAKRKLIRATQMKELSHCHKKLINATPVNLSFDRVLTYFVYYIHLDQNGHTRLHYKLCELAWVLNEFYIKYFSFFTVQEEQGRDVPSGGDVWVLVIHNAKPTDSGIYVCEVNSNPIVHSFHKLSGKFSPNSLRENEVV